MMARRYSPEAQKEVVKELHEYKRGKAHIGKSGQKIKSREQAIAVGLSIARKKGAEVPQKD